MAFFNRKLYQQKPREWGPASQVQASIFKNAERIGIDPASIAMAMPMWGPGDQLDYISAVNATNYEVSYQNNSLLFGGEQNNVNSARLSLPFDSSAFLGANPTTIILNTHKTNSDALNCLLSCGLPTLSTSDLRCLLSDDERVANERFELAVRKLDAWVTITWVGKHLKVNSADTLALVCDGLNNYTLYLSGVSQGSRTLSATSFPTTTRPLIVGAGNASSTSTNYWGFAGRLLSLYIINDVLNASQIAYLYDNPYFLLQRVAPVIYSVPATGGSTYTSSLVGNMPAPSGALTVSLLLTSSLTGNMPAPSGSIVKQVLKQMVGNIPAAAGGIVKQVNKQVAGNTPAAIGAINKTTSVTRQGNMPAPGGSMSNTFLTNVSVAGIMGTITGALSAVLNPVVTVGTKVLKIIGAAFKKLI